MSLLFKMLSRLVIAFLPRSKYLFISRLQSPSAVILGPKKIKSVTVAIVSPSICHEVMGPECHDLSFLNVEFAIIDRVKIFNTVNEAEIDVFLVFPCFVYDLTDVGNLISGSSALSKPNMYI